jgi:FkbM family methyltransferase
MYDRLPFKRPVLSLLRPLGAPHSIYKHLHFTGAFTVATPGGRSFRIIHYGDEIENELYWEGLPGRRERVSMVLWMKLCERARVILDVGANTGVYSLVAAAINPAAHIYGFEPRTYLFKRYDRNCRLNHFGIQAVQSALSNTAGWGLMRGWTLEKATRVKTKQVSGSDFETVPVIRLDAFIENSGMGCVDLIKIDVEGHEAEVLEGMGRFLCDFRPTLLIEVLSDAAGKKVEALLQDLNLLYFDLDEVGRPKLVPHLLRSSHWNYLACSRDTAASMELLTC